MIIIDHNKSKYSTIKLKYYIIFQMLHSRKTTLYSDKNKEYKIQEEPLTDKNFGIQKWPMT